ITEAKRALLRGKNALKGHLLRADRELLALRRAVEALAPRRRAEAASGDAPASEPPQAEQLGFFDQLPAATRPPPPLPCPSLFTLRTAPSFSGSCRRPWCSPCTACCRPCRTGWNTTPTTPRTSSC